MTRDSDPTSTRQAVQLLGGGQRVRTRASDRRRETVR
jgi:hypothetical protein